MEFTSEIFPRTGKSNLFETRKCFLKSEKIFKKQEKFHFLGKDRVNYDSNAQQEH